MSVTRYDAGNGRKTRTRADYEEALRLYHETYGELTQACFSPSAAKWVDRPDLVELYYAGRPDNGRPWPSLNAIKSEFDTFNAAREAIGLEPNTPGPASRRRVAGAHRPVRDVRERRVFVGDEKLDKTQDELRRAQDRARQLAGEAADLRHELAELRRESRRPVPRPEVRTRVETKVKTKTIKVRDERAVERLRGQVEELRTKLEDERASFRALRDQARAAERDRDKAISKLTESEREQLLAERELDSTRDRLAATESLMSRLRQERDELMARDADAIEAAAAADLVRAADHRAEAAEVRAARAEREALEHATAMTGESRKLTAAELEHFRSEGPAGPQLMANALKRLASARQHNGNLDAALTEVAKAAVNWRDRLGRQR